jgi:hypothetical protein
MDWTYPEGSGDARIFEIGRRMAEALGRVTAQPSLAERLRRIVPDRLGSVVGVPVILAAAG